MRLGILLLSLSLLALPLAEASKARMSVIGPAVSLPDDFQELFQNPVKAFSVDDQLSLEFGPQGEGGWLMSLSKASKLSVYVGHRTELFDDLVAEAANGLLPEQNPFEITYASKNEVSAWALSLWLSKARNKTTSASVEAQGLRAGLRFNEFEIYAHAGFRSPSKIDGLLTAQLDSQYRLGGEYGVEDMTYYVDAQSTRGRIAPDGGNDARRGWDEITLGFEHLEEDAEAYAFWGARLVNTRIARDPANAVTLNLPFYFGVESKSFEGVQWRAYLEQSIILNQRKDDPGTGFPATADNEGLNDTKAALGASYQGGPIRIDGALTAATTGTLTTDTLLTELSLNYLF
ncbi:MAG: hypothetical protein KF767_10000 [Bdellovibrionaceae bacterium]|nr:hypothetical protein [Pseudobdellovibrionaceae bacterium]